MTTIIGIQGKGWALIAADSLIVGGDQKFIASGMEKVVEKGEYVFAFAGDAIAGDIALHSWNAPKIPRGVNLDKFMMTDLLPSLKRAYVDYGYDPSPRNADNDLKDGSGFDALICLRGKIYQIDNDFSWVRDDRGIYGVGSGSSYALGALARATLSPTNTRTAANEARKAIEISISFDINTGGKVKVITQRENQMAAAKKVSKKAAYAAYEKTESKSMKAKELKSGESKGEKAKEMKSGMHMMGKKMMKNSSMKKMGKKK
jgi:ATP-dependent protease HslVU (ClpYQ) peptidase subunit